MTGNQEIFQKAMDNGHSAAWDQQWGKAAAYYQQAIEEFPDNAIALMSAGLAMYEMQELDEALVYYSKASVIKPDDPTPAEKMARIYERKGMLQQAVQTSITAANLFLKSREVDKSIENWVRVIALQPQNLLAHSRLSVIYERLGRKQEAVSEYLTCASLLQTNGDIVKALQAVEYAIKIIPNYDESEQYLQKLRNNQRLPLPKKPRGGTGPMRMAEVRRLEQPKTLSSNNPDPIAEARKNALIELAGLLFEQPENADPSADAFKNRRGFTPIARGTGSLVPDRGAQSRILLHLGQAIDSQTQENDSQAIKELEKAVEIGLSHPAAYFDLGLLLAETAGVKGLRYLQKSVLSNNYTMASHLAMGRIYEGTGDYPKAAVSYLQALKYADSETVNQDRANELRQLYDPIIESQSQQMDENKLKSLCENIRVQLIRPDWRNYLKSMRQQMPEMESGDSLPIAEMLLETSSGRVVEAMSNSRMLAKNNKMRSAMEEAFQALLISPTYLPLHTLIGDLLMQEGRGPEAVKKYMLVVKLYTLRGEPDQAIRLLNRVIKAAPMDLTVRSKLIELMIAQGRADEAIDQYMNLAGIYYHLAELEMARQTYASALRLSQKGRTEKSWNTQILYKIADIDMQRLDWRQAMRVFEQIRTLEPEDTQARGQLVDLNLRLQQDNVALSEIDNFSTLMENAGKRGGAIQFILNILEQYPDKLEIRRRLAELYSHDRKPTQSIEQMDFIASALIKNGDKRGAASVLQSIIALHPQNVEEYKTKLRLLQNN